MQTKTLVLATASPAQHAYDVLRATESQLAAGVKSVAMLQLAVSSAEERYCDNVGHASNVSRKLAEAQASVADAQKAVSVAHEHLSRLVAHYNLQDQVVMTGTGDKGTKDQPS